MLLFEPLFHIFDLNLIEIDAFWNIFEELIFPGIAMSRVVSLNARQYHQTCIGENSIFIRTVFIRKDGISITSLSPVDMFVAFKDNGQYRAIRLHVVNRVWICRNGKHFLRKQQ